MKKFTAFWNGLLLTVGIALVVVAVALIAFGVSYGYTEDHAFYDRIEAYHADDSARLVLQNEMDSLFSLSVSLEEDCQETEVLAVQAQIDSIEHTSAYFDLLGMPEPPQGFSMAYLVTIILVVIAMLPLFLGVMCLIAWFARRKKQKENKQTS